MNFLRVYVFLRVWLHFVCPFAIVVFFILMLLIYLQASFLHIFFLLFIISEISKSESKKVSYECDKYATTKTTTAYRHTVTMNFSVSIVCMNQFRFSIDWTLECCTFRHRFHCGFSLCTLYRCDTGNSNKMKRGKTIERKAIEREAEGEGQITILTFNMWYSCHFFMWESNDNDNDDDDNNRKK